LGGCLGRARFQDPAESPYVLPYPVGKAYQVTQSYCFANGSHHNQLAYDFDMPIGDDVTAARAGMVVEAWDGHPDNSQGHHNYVFIKHDDGTVAFYAHLQQGGVVVQIGEHVEVGQRIAASGNSGTTGGPHLHFMVYASWPPREGYDVPVTFRNAEGVFYASGALLMGKVYEALSY
jgi:murein DD-endopeptidase MepM/ murein hydrolase activator NlpD